MQNKLLWAVLGTLFCLTINGNALAGSVNLLNYLEYEPSERDQGSCGNCWVWAGTGVMEIAHSVRNGVKDRLSVQFLNSCKSDQYACCTGNLQMFSGWYGSKGLSVPWSNTNGEYQDAYTSYSCPNGSSTRSCIDISTDPNYRITSITPTTISTRGVGQSTAISNIKNVLNQNKAIFMAFYLPDESAWAFFKGSWYNLNETAIWPPDSYCGSQWIDGEGGGHAVLVVGYNDDHPDPFQHYWTVVNSWGITSGRPTGIFHMKMRINYDCSYYYGSTPIRPALEWQTLDIKMPTLRVTSPNGGETWGTGTTRTITWTSSDLNQAGNLNIYYWYNNDWQKIAGPLSANTTSYIWSIPNTPTSSTGIRIGNWVNNAWETRDQSDQAFTLEAVSPPSTPVGPTNGTIGTLYNYSTAGSSSSAGHSVQYFFDWGDGTNSGWLPVGTNTASHAWASAATYLVKTQARCYIHPSVVSGWSGILPVTLTVGLFLDIPTGYWAEIYINTIYNVGITVGCAPDDPGTPENERRYCPEDYVTREQMAAFIVRAVVGEPPSNYCETGVPFPDVSSDMWSCRYIKRLYELGITTRYSDGRYGPYDQVLREQMATFLVRAVEGEPPLNYCDSGVPFPDVSSDMWSCRYIKRLKELGITTGYGDGRYGPYDLVTRAQMAAFLSRAFLEME